MGLGWPQAWLLGLPTAVVYGSLALFTSILHNVFLLYYVDTFVSVYKINKVAFWVGETVFLLWNSLNDPLFGWLSDRQFLSSQPWSGARLSSRAVVLARVRALGRHGPLLALSFLAFWVPWAPAGLQFLLCLCLYDGFLTLVDLHHHALLADLALSAHDRTHLNFYCSLFSAAGSLSVFASYAFWNKEDFSSFRAFCVALAAGSGLGFLGATQLLRRRVEVAGKDPGCSTLAMDGGLYGEELLVGSEEVGSITLGQYLRQLARHQNFLWFVGMDLVQVFHCHFNSNFFPLFLEHLLSDHISLSTGSFLLGVSYVAPHLNNLYFLPLCQRWGVYAVVRGLFLLKLGLSLLMLVAGPDHPGLLCFFIASNRVFTEGTCKLLTLVVTDLVDEDLVLNHRKQAASALLFGMVALVTKPGQTFAPLLGTWLLCFYTGHDLFQQPPMTPVGSAQPWPEPPAPAPAQAPTLRQGCFYLLVLVPITCALLQLFTWSQFTLHGRRLHMVKAQRQNLAQVQTLDIKTV
ncbi:transmembrane protein 180 isoform X1 [Ictidomys tridecemlineatus]|uniref:Major facilitator superfamily domain containing 13A n=1 Tax=Ictidomys tridecemlineatus TaxID=43179 RepID=I3MMX0_ICTTR|nr:transmembrane protein 180 isoform X1 [Ictidomys tridecemlineatus]XP_021587521.1 transmembrane protein 180 isoform X1 [Ictidomys tridecemlineatus]XP_040129487.1 transmembrane protein 180 isoform X1 [Ictidomys tridecemlineatus]KAG3264178.1 major facilitator superfamily domain containing 13A, transcript variant X1 [Ictidomys tridecemlineatus]KAG3264179.1 major facilitator superfamily domain containing 13A, transcript variant X3 [Ictidomys tridecemlineatus]KAG3264180.1 major facilitator superfa